MEEIDFQYNCLPYPYVIHPPNFHTTVIASRAYTRASARVGVYARGCVQARLCIRIISETITIYNAYNSRDVGDCCLS